MVPMSSTVQTHVPDAAPKAVHDSRCTQSSWPFWVWFCAGLIVVAGAVLRIVHWAHWRSLWLDEIYLANSLTQRGFSDLLFKPLDGWQAAPPGFLLSKRLPVAALGTGERALRIVSLFFGLLSLPLFVAVARRALAPRAALIALAFAAVLWPLIYYSGELKPYSCDVVFALAIPLFTARFLERPTRVRAALATLIGSLGIFFSYPAVFVVAGAAAIAIFHSRRLAAAAGLLRALVLLVIWILCLALQYLCFVRPIVTSGAHSHLVDYWAVRDGFMPLSPLSAPLWLAQRVLAILREPGAMMFWHPDAALVALLTGIAIAATSNPRADRIQLTWGLILSCLPFALAASALTQYPLADRLALFLTPIFLMGMARGIDSLLVLRPWAAPSAAALVLLLFTLGSSATWAARSLITPPGREESLQAYQWVASHWQNGDALYLSHYAEPSYHYYKSRAHWPSDPEQTGLVWLQPDFERYLPGISDDVHRFAGRSRVWVVIIHADQDTTQSRTIAAMSAIGNPRPELAHAETGAIVLNYDCSSAPR